MPPKSRKQGRTAAALTSSVSASGKSKSKYPEPFEEPDAALKPFLEYLDDSHVYITHVDRTQRLLKRNTFLQVLVLNIAILGLLAWRAYYVAPYYAALFMTFMRRDSPLNIDTENTPWPVLLEAVMNRSGTLFLDFMLFRIMGSWPWDFFVGQTSPTFWRTSIGFREIELTVRRSRQWDQHLPKEWLYQTEQGAGKPVFEERIMPGINKDYIRRKTGYLMQDKSWDLDYALMVMAHHLVETKKIALKDFEKTVFVHDENHGWLVWPIWKLDEGGDTEQRQKLVMFKDKLTRMGKENLFFRWIEIVQYESSLPGGFTVERQEAAMRSARELFEKQGVDFEQFWNEVGGPQGLPGWDV